MDLKRDQNHITAGGGVDDDDSTTVRPLKVDPSTDYLTVLLQSGAVVATPATQNKRDQNFVPTLYGVSSVDGVTLIPIRTDENGYILVDLEII